MPEGPADGGGGVVEGPGSKPAVEAGAASPASGAAGDAQDANDAAAKAAAKAEALKGATRHWTPEEDKILLNHVMRYGSRYWGLLQATGQLPLRDQKSCCNRFLLLKKRCFGTIPGADSTVLPPSGPVAPPSMPFASPAHPSTAPLPTPMQPPAPAPAGPPALALPHGPPAPPLAVSSQAPRMTAPLPLHPHADAAQTGLTAGRAPVPLPPLTLPPPPSLPSGPAPLHSEPSKAPAAASATTPATTASAPLSAAPTPAALPSQAIGATVAPPFTASTLNSGSPGPGPAGVAGPLKGASTSSPSGCAPGTAAPATAAFSPRSQPLLQLPPKPASHPQQHTGSGPWPPPPAGQPDSPATGAPSSAATASTTLFPSPLRLTSSALVSPGQPQQATPPRAPLPQGPASSGMATGGLLHLPRTILQSTPPPLARMQGPAPPPPGGLHPPPGGASPATPALGMRRDSMVPARPPLGAPPQAPFPPHPFHALSPGHAFTATPSERKRNNKAVACRIAQMLQQHGPAALDQDGQPQQPQQPQQQQQQEQSAACDSPSGSARPQGLPSQPGPSAPASSAQVRPTPVNAYLVRPGLGVQPIGPISRAAPPAALSDAQRPSPAGAFSGSNGGPTHALEGQQQGGPGAGGNPISSGFPSASTPLQHPAAASSPFSTPMHRPAGLGTAGALPALGPTALGLPSTPARAPAASSAAATPGAGVSPALAAGQPGQAGGRPPAWAAPGTPITAAAQAVAAVSPAPLPPAATGGLLAAERPGAGTGAGTVLPPASPEPQLHHPLQPLQPAPSGAFPPHTPYSARAAPPSVQQPVHSAFSGSNFSVDPPAGQRPCSCGGQQQDGAPTWGGPGQNCGACLRSPGTAAPLAEPHQTPELSSHAAPAQLHDCPTQQQVSQGPCPPLPSQPLLSSPPGRSLLLQPVPKCVKLLLPPACLDGLPSATEAARQQPLQPPRGGSPGLLPHSLPPNTPGGEFGLPGLAPHRDTLPAEGAPAFAIPGEEELRHSVMMVAAARARTAPPPPLFLLGEPASPLFPGSPGMSGLLGEDAFGWDHLAGDLEMAHGGRSGDSGLSGGTLDGPWVEEGPGALMGGADGIPDGPTGSSAGPLDDDKGGVCGGQEETPLEWRSEGVPGNAPAAARGGFLSSSEEDEEAERVQEGWVATTLARVLQRRQSMSERPGEGEQGAAALGGGLQDSCKSPQASSAKAWPASQGGGLVPAPPPLLPDTAGGGHLSAALKRRRDSPGTAVDEEERPRRKGLKVEVPGEGRGTGHQFSPLAAPAPRSSREAAAPEGLPAAAVKEEDADGEHCLLAFLDSVEPLVLGVGSSPRMALSPDSLSPGGRGSHALFLAGTPRQGDGVAGGEEHAALLQADLDWGSRKRSLPATMDAAAAAEEFPLDFPALRGSEDACSQHRGGGLGDKGSVASAKDSGRGDFGEEEGPKRRRRHLTAECLLREGSPEAAAGPEPANSAVGDSESELEDGGGGGGGGTSRERRGAGCACPPATGCRCRGAVAVAC